jgi:hypothetical protein
MMRTLRSATPLLLLLAGAPALAAAEPLADGLRRCAREAVQEQRLACYDALAKTLPKVEADQFGMTAAIAQQREPEAAAAHPAKPAVLPATIAALQEGHSGEWIFTLDNGQVWIQQEPKPGMRFEVGEKVQIEHGAMSSLWLAADRGRKTRVKRVR